MTYRDTAYAIVTFTRRSCYDYNRAEQQSVRDYDNKVMAALPNIGGTLCSTPQSLVDAHY